MTCSIWYLRRRATLVTASAGIAEGMRSLVLEGRTGSFGQPMGTSTSMYQRIDYAYDVALRRESHDGPGCRCRTASSTGP